MHFADLALTSKFKKEIAAFETYSLQAYELEAQAAELVKDDLSAEPTRSVLYRSAATLAVDCKKYPEALYLIRTGLAGQPSDELVQELKALEEKVSDELYLVGKQTVTAIK